MITIPVAVCGDHWVNVQEVKELLADIDLTPVTLDLHAEGPSLHALGIVDTVLKYLPADLAYVTNWSNSVEHIPFRRLNQHLLSHFFWYSDRYRACVSEQRTQEFLFGYFVGRRTVPRCVMLKDIDQTYSERFLVSLMHTVADFNVSPLEPVSSWVDPDDFHQWWHSTNISSLDNHTIRDQFSDIHNTNASLLQWYPKFDIELVAETYTHGDTFFVTEKTVRPIVAGKSMLIFGPKNYLSRLRNLGFQTWHDIWDESYDQLTGINRWNAIKSLIDELMTKDQEQLYQQCRPVIKHNQQHAELLIKKHKPQ